MTSNKFFLQIFYFKYITQKKEGPFYPPTDKLNSIFEHDIPQPPVNIPQKWTKMYYLCWYYLIWFNVEHPSQFWKYPIINPSDHNKKKNEYILS